MKCGIVQAGSSLELWENVNALKSYVEEAKAQGCSVICFPEAFLTGYAPKAVSNLAISKQSEALQYVAGMAKEYQMDLLVGFMERSETEYHLTHGIFCGDGTREFYRKTHLGQREQDVFTAGDKLQVFTLSCGLKAGIQMCVETHFPEITQTLSLSGAEVVFAPHAVPRVAGSRKVIWSKIIPARSYDNRVYMACCNLWDEEKFGGGCLITDPNGEVVEECYEEKEALICFDVKQEQVSCYHENNDNMKRRYYPGLRRTELYTE